MQESLLLQALKCKNQSRPPMWLMRQAGRYIPEYRKMREKYSLLEMFHSPELAAEVTLLPFKSFDFDASIIFSDILVIPEALNVGLSFKEDIGPVIERPLKTLADIEALPVFSAKDQLGYVAQAIKLVKPQLKVPLLGFSGAPFTLASYMIEGGSSKDLKKTKLWMLREPESFHTLLSKLTDCIIEYLKMQIDAGVQAVQIFDSWANHLGYSQFQEFSLKYMEKIIKQINVPVILFCRGSSVFAKDLANLSPSGISLDWNVDITTVRSYIPKSVAIQGNLDPDLLFAPKAMLIKETKKMLQGMKGDPGYIFNLGHGIKPDTPVDSVKTLVEVIRNSL